MVGVVVGAVGVLCNCFESLIVDERASEVVLLEVPELIRAFFAFNVGGMPDMRFAATTEKWCLYLLMSAQQTFLWRFIAR